MIRLMRLRLDRDDFDDNNPRWIWDKFPLAEQSLSSLSVTIEQHLGAIPWIESAQKDWLANGTTVLIQQDWFDAGCPCNEWFDAVKTTAAITVEKLAK